MPEFLGTLRTPRLSGAPTSPVPGEMYYDTTTSTLYWWNGTTWISAQGGSGAEVYEQPGTPSGTPPAQGGAAPHSGAIWIDTDDSPAQWTYDSDPVGTVKAYAGTVIPTNWVLADGRTLTQAAYPELASAMGIGVGQSFSIPDLRNRFIYGASAPVGSAWAGGGAAVHLLTAAESGLPSHFHSNLTRVNQSITWTTGGNYPAAPGYDSGGAAAADTASIAAQNASSAHNNMPPYIVLAWIIKITGPQINAGGALIGAAGSPGIVPSYGTSFPANPVDGQQHIFVDSLTNPTYQWYFRYNAGSSSAYKWEFIGGSPIAFSVLGNEATATVGAWLDLATVGPRFVIPTGCAGDWWATAGANTFSTVAGTSSWIGISVGAVNPSFQMPMSIPNANLGEQISLPGGRVNAVAAGSDVRMRYHNGGAAANTMSWQYRYITVQPIRVSG